jgi:acetyl-CoA carboxylase biotin carboxyl carrier protein
MDLRKLKTLIDLVSESNISELEITEEEGKVRIVKATPNAVGLGPASPVFMAPTPMTAPMPSAHGAASPAHPAHPMQPSVGSEPAEAPAGQVIKSPMVGTFYRAASPGAKAFADVGQVVKEGDAVCIIEAMKIMNEIESDVSGTIVKVLCENGQAVEFGQPLFIVE